VENFLHFAEEGLRFPIVLTASLHPEALWHLGVANQCISETWMPLCDFLVSWFRRASALSGGQDRRAASFSKRPSNGASGWRGGRLPYFSNANRKKL